MIKQVLALSLLVLAGTTGAHAQVYRCGDSNVYTDKPCDSATPVDLRTNIMDAGPRGFPAPEAPQAPIIVPRAPRNAPDGTGSVWDRKDASDSDFRSRTGPYTPQTYTPR